MPERIVLFGGTFDPVHHGHLIIARAVAEQCGFDRITLVPTASPPHKPVAGASAADRMEMLRLATEGDGLFEVSRMEIDRHGPSYTIDTLAALRRQGEQAELVLLMGADMLEDLPKWHRADEVVEQARIVVAARPPWQDRMDATLARLRGRFSDEIVQRLRDSVVGTPLIDISSTAIRRRVSLGESILYLTPPSVVRYIADRGLYGV